MTTSTVRIAAISAALAFVAVAAPSFAASGYEGCYLKTYDAAHMAAHRGQTVTSLRLKVSALDNAPFIASTAVTVTLRGRRTRYFTGGDCTLDSGVFNCGMDEDAGAFILAHAGADLRLTLTGSFRLNRANQSSDESNGPFVKDSNPEDHTFLLKRVAASVCN